jgi:hypothetical protein
MYVRDGVAPCQEKKWHWLDMQLIVALTSKMVRGVS